MHGFVIGLHVFVSFVLIVTVLLQAGKGASIGASFGSSSSQALFGSSGPATFLGKLTAACAAVFMLTSLYLTYLSFVGDNDSIMSEVPGVTEEVSDEAPGPGTVETAPSEDALPENVPNDTNGN